MDCLQFRIECDASPQANGELSTSGQGAPTYFDDERRPRDKSLPPLFGKTLQKIEVNAVIPKHYSE